LKTPEWQEDLVKLCETYGLQVTPGASPLGVLLGYLMHELGEAKHGLVMAEMEIEDLKSEVRALK